jgi:NAD(P)-dependent dehydrogenase (short-subunit alcohol dehydrogenase family)
MSKTWLITGSSRGLGRDLVHAALAAGDRVVATARRVSDLGALGERYGERVRSVELDVTDASAARAAVAVATEQFGGLDVVVNNAGYANINSIEDLSEDDFRRQFETNFFGVYNMTRAALPVLREQRAGHIVQISSIGDRTVTPGLGSYQAAKWAVGGFSEVLAKEVGPLGIHVTVLEPGGMRTDWAGSSTRIDDVRPEYQATVGAMVGALSILRDTGTFRSDPAKVAELVVRVVSMQEPPLRLLAGSDAVFFAKQVLRLRAAEDSRWAAESCSTDFAGLEDFAESDIGKMLAVRE